MIFKGAHPSMYSAHTRRWMTESLDYFRNLSVWASLLRGQSSKASAHKDSKNKFLPLVCGCLFEKLLHKKVLRAHTLSKTTGDVKTSEVWENNSSGCCVQQKSCIITKVITLIHHILPPGSSQRPQKHLNGIKGSLLRRKAVM